MPHSAGDDRRRVSPPVGERAATRQSFKEESDVNAIMKKYAATGVMPPQAAKIARYGDFSTALEYREALDRVRAAEEAFRSLPSRVRDHVGNNPQEFIAMILDPERQDEVRDLGLFEEPAASPAIPSTPSEPSDPASEDSA